MSCNLEPLCLNNNGLLEGIVVVVACYLRLLDFPNSTDVMAPAAHSELLPKSELLPNDLEEGSFRFLPVGRFGGSEVGLVVCYAMPCHAMQYHIILHYTIPCYTIPYTLYTMHHTLYCGI